MKVLCSCVQCAVEDNIYFGGFERKQIQNDGVYIFECAQNHKSVIIFQNQRYETLFEIGCEALFDGYTRESVTSFASARERFFEFYVKVVLLNSGMSVEAVGKFWREIGSQSERQYGAFLSLYSFVNKKPYDFIDNNMITFRNNVIHKGYIPSPKESFEFGEFVYQGIVRLVEELKRDFKESFHKLIGIETKEKFDFAYKIYAKEFEELRKLGKGFSSCSPAFVITSISEKNDETSLKKHLLYRVNILVTSARQDEKKYLRSLLIFLQ